MSDLRRNPLTGQWVILAENRGARPQDVVVQQTVRDPGECPFCEGHEKRTPDETLALREPVGKPNGPGWRVRVVPNKYPALEDANGIHEIIIESPRHLTSVTQLDDRQFADVLEVYRQRLAALRQSGNFHGALIFKNGGPAAGATLAHLHSQLLAMASPEPLFLGRAASFQRHAAVSGKCVLCEMQQDEIKSGQRVVGQSKHFTAFCPFASRFAYETWIIPREHAGHFDEISPAAIPELAALFRSLLVKVEAIVKLPAYNYIVHTAPFDTPASDHYHWHIEILPRIANLAGFELGTGSFINTVSPDKAAEQLRRA
jgi:UDPglucose--hexose-1-phosphate uridylyltransferase